MNKGKGRIAVVGTGPGNSDQLTFRAGEVLKNADVIVGYKTYLGLLKDFLKDSLGVKEIVSSGMRHEEERALRAVELAQQGKNVAVISSGDAGIYGMAGLIYEVANQNGWDAVDVEVVAGVSALNSAASLLGAPLMHDFAVISLSDLMTTWEDIALRLAMAARGDFVIVLYNPKSTKRTEQIAEAHGIIRQHRNGTTPVGIVTAAYRDSQKVTVTDLDHMLEADIGMQSTVIIGNSSTKVIDGVMITPRGYRIEQSGNREES